MSPGLQYGTDKNSKGENSNTNVYTYIQSLEAFHSVDTGPLGAADHDQSHKTQVQCPVLMIRCPETGNR